MHQAKSRLSRLVEALEALEALEAGKEAEFVIARNGRPAARLLPFRDNPSRIRIGVARGEFEVPEDIDGLNDVIVQHFGGSIER
ncbi:MAG: prevent-host-death protein [Hyphomicrobiaceae bacterium]|nr:prevent-host-death protein [Hyphomicrobiaceae bacterium]